MFGGGPSLWAVSAIGSAASTIPASTIMRTEESIAMTLSQCVVRIIAAAALSAVAHAADIKFDEWMTPSKPPFPHDPEFAPDGSVWYTGQRANVLGRLDPKTGDIKEYPLPTANSGPHGLTAD